MCVWTFVLQSPEDLTVVLVLSLGGCHRAEVSGQAGTAPQSIPCFWMGWEERGCGMLLSFP